MSNDGYIWHNQFTKTRALDSWSEYFANQTVLNQKCVGNPNDGS